MRFPWQKEARSQTPDPVDTRSEKERKEQRFHDLMTRRHRLAVLAYHVESGSYDDLLDPEAERMKEPTTLEYKLKRIEQDTKDIAPHLKRRFMEEVRELFTVEERAKQVEELIRDELQRQKGYEMTPDRLGHYLFGSATRLVKSGSINARRLSGAFVMEFEKEEDYVRVLQATGDDGRHPGGGSFQELEIDLALPREQESFHKVHLILVNMESASDSKELVIRHERQHFLNAAVYRNFRATEPRLRPAMSVLEEMIARRKPDPAHNEHFLKNELLAHLRDGAGSRRIRGITTSESYLFSVRSMPEPDREECLQVIKDVGNAIEYLDSTDARSIFYYTDNRAILVHHLADVPLRKIPAYLFAYAQWYLKEIEPLPACHLDPAFQNPFYVPEGYHIDIKRMNQLYREEQVVLSQLFKQVRGTRMSRSTESKADLVAEHSAIEVDIEHQFDLMRRDGVLVPSIHLLKPVPADQKEKLDSYFQSLADGLSKLDQAYIDKGYDLVSDDRYKKDGPEITEWFQRILDEQRGPLSFEAIKIIQLSWGNRSFTVECSSEDPKIDFLCRFRMSLEKREEIKKKSSA